MNVRALVVPWDSGQRDARLGRGPERLLRGGIEEGLERAGHPVSASWVGPRGGFHAEVSTAFDLAAVLAGEVAAARADGAFPLVLSGNCISALGTVAALGPAGTGVVWLDAHGDLNTPETTRTGFLDGMALSVVLGRCWRTLAAGVPGHAPLPETHVVHVAGRDLEASEEHYLASAELARVAPAPAGRLLPSLRQALEDLPASVERLYLHVDLDALDPSEGRANEFAAPGGLSLQQLLEVVSAVGDRGPIAAAALTAYDPALDTEARILRAAREIACAVLNAATR